MIFSSLLTLACVAGAYAAPNPKDPNYRAIGLVYTIAPGNPLTEPFKTNKTVVETNKLVQIDFYGVEIAFDKNVYYNVNNSRTQCRAHLDEGGQSVGSLPITINHPARISAQNNRPLKSLICYQASENEAKDF